MSNLAHLAARDLRCYIAEEIPYIWDQVAELIQKALDRGSNYCLADIMEGLCNGSMQLWTYMDVGVHKAAMVTCIQEKQGIKFLLFLAMGGEGLDTWIKYLPVVEDWAKDEGCQEARIYGRHGWAKRTGYEVKYTKMTRTL